MRSESELGDCASTGVAPPKNRRASNPEQRRASRQPLGRKAFLQNGEWTRAFRPRKFVADMIADYLKFRVRIAEAISNGTRRFKNGTSGSRCAARRRFA